MAAQTFAGVLEAADELTLPEQEDLVEILRRRVVDRRRDELAREIDEAAKELAAGGCEPRSVGELMREILE